MENNAEKRVRKLEKLYSSPISDINSEVFSIDTLIDALLVLYDECNTSLLKRDKHVAEFLEIGKLYTYV